MSSTKVAALAAVELGRVALMFGRVNRITYQEDGRTFESDTDHTVMLSLIACSLAERFYPVKLIRGMVAQFALVHDLVEVYAGDTPTIRKLNADASREKEEREANAAWILEATFGSTLPWVPDWVARYRAQADPEARFVRAVDKLCPKITHILNGGTCLGIHDMTIEEYDERTQHQLGEYASEFPELLEVRQALVDQLRAKLANAARCAEK